MPLATDTQAAAAQETSDGTLVGRNADSKVGFYGTAPITRPVVATGATTAQIAAALAALGLTRLT
jgi:hypothetical protein